MKFISQNWDNLLFFSKNIIKPKNEGKEAWKSTKKQKCRACLESTWIWGKGPVKAWEITIWQINLIWWCLSAFINLQNNKKIGVFKIGFSIFRALKTVFAALKPLEFCFDKCVWTLLMAENKLRRERRWYMTDCHIIYWLLSLCKQ